MKKNLNEQCIPRISERAFFNRIIKKISVSTRQNNFSFIAVVDTVLQSWGRVVRPHLPSNINMSCCKITSLPEVAEFISWLVSKPILDAAYWISSAYSLWIGGVERKAFSMYFTPPAIVERMLNDLDENGVSFTKASFFDPACGGAAFLVPIASRIKDALYAEGYSPREILEHIEKNLSGADLDPNLCHMSKFFLRIVLADEIVVEAYEPNFQIVCQNSLIARHEGKEVDVVICNPPYRKLLPFESRLYKELYGNVIQNQANLYSLFVALCIKHAAGNGFVSLLTPTSYFSGKSFSNLRKFVIENTKVRKFGLINERSSVFIDVEQDTALTLLEKVKNRCNANIEIVSITEEGFSTKIGHSSLPLTGEAWPLPRNQKDLLVLKHAAQSRFRLKDYGYKARIGAFVWNRDTRNTYATLEDAIKAKAIAPKRLLWSSEIEAGKTIDLKKMRGNVEESAWVDLEKTEHRSLIVNPSVVLQRVTSNDQARRLIAAVVMADENTPYMEFVGENHVVILEADRQVPSISPELVMAILLSSTVDRYFRCISGATNVSIYELDQLPLPCADSVYANMQAGMSIDDAVNLAYSSASLSDAPSDAKLLVRDNSTQVCLF